MILATYYFKSLTGDRHSSSAHLSVIVHANKVGSDLALVAPYTGWKVTESSVIYIAFGVILNKFSSDGLLTVAKTNIMTVFMG